MTMTLLNAVCSFLVLCVLVENSAEDCAKCNANCPTGDCMANDVSQKSVCSEVVGEAALANQCQWWGNGLGRNTDYEVLKGRIIAYKIQWFSGSWSGWFVPEYNDIDCKFNVQQTCNGKQVCPNSLRRMWSYFYDHSHTYIICR
ncbi:hypothetical protein HELRODRAFT_170694 [Helobdella robusta]|uniref:Uncharacterized protein n=1 Tax=Helobdella robusta TaxID=6412 RepID=T1F3B8_HELRO|nr:hypothetical protein HELRODRAFT_170694 [Helobdella robusta]ESO07361.1 hypothetical protein HELRODRAFT_170694 [Helobdella robusta]